MSEDERTYVVQVVIIKEVTVEAYDDLQAERVAFAKFGKDKHNITAMLVLEPKHLGGALQSEDPRDNWRFAREHFGAIDRSWVE